MTTRDVIAATPQTSMRKVQDILREHCISGTPVLEDGRLIGIVSLMDLIQTLEAMEIDGLVADHMAYNVEPLCGDERVVSAIAKFQQTGLGRFPVVERGSGKLIGILAQGDIVKGTLLQLDIDCRPREAGYHHGQHFFQDILSEETSIILRYTIQSHDFVHGGKASSQFKRSLQNLGIHPSILRRVTVATYEAEMNLVLHATAGGTIRAEVRADSIRIDVCDEWPGISDVDQAMQPGYSTAPEWIREMGFGAGMGLSNIQRCADEMSLQRHTGRRSTSSAQPGTRSPSSASWSPLGSVGTSLASPSCVLCGSTCTSTPCSRHVPNRRCPSAHRAAGAGARPGYDRHCRPQLRRQRRVGDRGSAGHGPHRAAGDEVETREEVHMLCMFDTLGQVEPWQRTVDAARPGLPNRESFFGTQYVVDATGAHRYTEGRLLATSTSVSVEQVAAGVDALGGLCVAAHIDRPSSSILSNLGFVPQGLPISGVEITPRSTGLAKFVTDDVVVTEKRTRTAPEGCFSSVFEDSDQALAQHRATRTRLTSVWKSVEYQTGLAQYGVLVDSDAHRLAEMGAYTCLRIAAPTVAELRLALWGQQGRRTWLLLPSK